MTLPPRPMLTLKNRGLVDPATDRRIDLADYDLLLPCRRFKIEHKVAVLGRVSLTAEFLLRLLKSLDGISEADASAFFGFDRREAAFVLAEGVDQGFVVRRDGRLWLSTAGHALFRDGSTQPEIFDVESRVETIGFDLISFAPQQWTYLDAFELKLPETPMLNGKPASEGGQYAIGAFKRFYSQIPDRRDAVGAKRSLYSIGEVLPGDRFQVPMRLTLAASGLKPFAADMNFDQWRPEHEQDERPEILAAAAAFKEALITSRRPNDADAYRLLSDLAPEFLDDFVRGDEMTVDRYYRRAFEQAGEPRADRPTVPILGSLLLRPNLRRFADVLGYGLQAQHRPEHILWAAPQIPHWGAVTTLPELIKQAITQIVNRIQNPTRSRPSAICLAAGRDRPYLDETFDEIARPNTTVLPPAFEALLIPGVLAAGIVHAPIGSQSGLPVPLGILSFDPRVVARMTALIGPAFLNAMPTSRQDLLARDLQAELAM